jgi:hypothetical protein
MGNNATTGTDEDEVCALHMRNILQGRPGNAEAVRQVILAGGEIAHFHDPGVHGLPDLRGGRSRLDRRLCEQPGQLGFLPSS